MRQMKRFLRDYFCCSFVPLLYFIIFIICGVQYPTKLDFQDLNLGDEKRLKPDFPVFGNSSSSLLVFLHVSDSHISKLIPKIQKNFKDFVDEIVPRINPKFVLHTGDITDAKLPGEIMAKEQIPFEWEFYKSQLTNKGYFDSNFWYDIQGNHDCLGLLSEEEASNYYYKYSPQGALQESKGKPKVWNFQINTEYDSLNFIGINWNRMPGVNGPFAFFTTDNESILDSLYDQLNAKVNIDANHTFIFGHYPLTYNFQHHKTSKTHKRFQDLMKEHRVLSHLVGHSHAKGMYSTLYDRYDGLMELEVGDLRIKKCYRIFALDNDILSFVDRTLDDQWPIVLITNPTNAKFITLTEPLNRIKMSGYIRVLIFERESDPEIKQIKYYIDDKAQVGGLVKIKNQTHPLYVAKWNPEDYKSGLHKIKIEVQLADNSKVITEQAFSVDGTQKYKGSKYYQQFQRQNLFGLFTSLAVVSFFIFWLPTTVAPSLMKKLYSNKNWGEFLLNSEKQLKKGVSNHNLLSIFKQHLSLTIYKFTVIPKSFKIILYISGLALFCLPITIGPMVHQQFWGISFIWTSHIHGTNTFYLFNVLFYSIFLVFVYMPSCNIITYPIVFPINKKNHPLRLLSKPIILISILLIIFGFVILVGIFYLGYGTLSVLLSFSLVWNSIMLIVLVLITVGKEFKSIKKLKNSNSQLTINHGSSSMSDTVSETRGLLPENGKINL
ncbi:transmembrane protein [Anaeramoeba flamelloides]|uniref:Transmembrane protein n=1 Tax=Anaeramoeba flamelloides TaxID=1746091 RepID=A0ABQ8Z0R8_9EUKA|nr:transmembrane protein [Anaeramoeba flamelloides]